MNETDNQLYQEQKPSSLHPVVSCTGKHPDCANANYGIGCYHRLPHEHSNNCKVCTALNTGLHFCRHRNVECKCS